MKTTILICLLALIGLTACKKDNSNKIVITSTLSGKYAMFKFSDTLFNSGLRSDGISDLTIATFAGDTSYLNPGTKYYTIEPNSIVNYNPSLFLADTLNFTSSTNGIETTVATPFTYSLKTNAFDDGSNIIQGNYSEIITIYSINSTTIKLWALERGGNTIGDSRASYYKKL